MKMKKLWLLVLLPLVFFLGFSSCSKDKDAEDTVAPVMTLIGNNPMILQQGVAYTEPGCKAIDDVDGDISSMVVSTHNINIQVEGDYTVNYSVSDKAGNKASKTRHVTVMSF